MKGYNNLTNLEKVAAGYSCRERACANCEFSPGPICPHMHACHHAFMRGFVKGVKYKKKSESTRQLDKVQKIQQEVAQYIAERYNQKPHGWFSDTHFVDHHGCDGFIFKSELAARRHIMKNIHEYGSECQSAMTDEEWIDMLIGFGYGKRKVRNAVKNEQWEKVAKMMLDNCGAQHFLSTYSGGMAVLSNGDLLYY